MKSLAKVLCLGTLLIAGADRCASAQVPGPAPFPAPSPFPAVSPFPTQAPFTAPLPEPVPVAPPVTVPPVPTSPGFYVTPTFTVSEEFDDNVFVSSVDPQWDFITRFTPGVELGYRSEPFTLLASGSVDAEIYARNPELSDAANRKRAALRSRYSPYRLLSVGLDVTYLETNDPSEVVPLTGLQLGRRKATGLLVTPSVQYQLTPRDTARASYDFERDTAEDSPSNTAHRVRLGFAHQFTALDTGLIGYRFAAYETEGLSTTTYSHTPSIGWIRQLTPVTTLTVEGGPRFVLDGGTSVQPDVHGRIDHQFRLVRVALDYLRTEALVVGRPGVQELETITASLETEPIKLLRLRVEPGYFRTFGGPEPTTRTYNLLVSLVYPLRTWLAATLGYRFSYEDQAGTSLHRNVVTLGLTAGYPFRIAP